MFGASRKAELDRFALLCHQQMQLEAVEVALFARLSSTIGLVLIDATAQDAVVVADGHRHAVNHIDLLTVLLLEVGAELGKEGLVVGAHPLQTTAETTATQVNLDVALLIEHLVAQCLVAAEEHRCHQGNRHHLCIADAALRVVPMVRCLQQIVTQTVDKYNVSVHEGLQGLVFGLVAYNRT